MGPQNVGIAVTITGGLANYTVQHTYDNVLDKTYAPVWFNHPLLTNQTVNAQGGYGGMNPSIAPGPVSAIRLNVASGEGTVRLTIVEAGISNR